MLARRGGETVRVVPPRREPQREPESAQWTEVADFADARPDDGYPYRESFVAETRPPIRVKGIDRELFTAMAHHVSTCCVSDCGRAPTAQSYSVGNEF